MTRSRKGMFVGETKRRAAEKGGEEKGVAERQKCGFVTEAVQAAEVVWETGPMPFIKTWNTEKSVGLA